MNRSLIVAALLLLAACKDKKDTGDGEGSESYFPAVSFLKSQVTAVDTSLYNIIRVETENGRSDTAFVRREDFRTYARPFLELEEIASDEWKDDYTETKTYDESMERVVLVYEPKDKEDDDLPVVRQDITFETDASGSARPKTIFITKAGTEDGNPVHRQMLWQVDRRFTITTRTSNEGKETVKKLEVIWDRFPAN